MYTDTSVRTEGARSSAGPPDADMAGVQDANLLEFAAVPFGNATRLLAYHVAHLNQSRSVKSDWRSHRDTSESLPHQIRPQDAPNVLHQSLSISIYHVHQHSASPRVLPTSTTDQAQSLYPVINWDSMFIGPESRKSLISSLVSTFYCTILFPHALIMSSVLFAPGSNL